MTSYIAKVGLLGLVFALTLSGVWTGQSAYAQAPPPLPTVASNTTPTATPGAATPPTFYGLMIVVVNITVTDGSEVPDGLPIVARIGNEYETEPVFTENGSAFLKIVPNIPDATGRIVTVYVDTVPIDQELVYTPGLTDYNRPVTIPNLPLPTPTPSPIPVLPAVYSGTVTIAGAKVQEGMVLVARIGDTYETFPANLEGPNFTGLVIVTTDDTLVGKPVEFYLNGVAATHSPGPFVPGKNQRLDLVFLGVPTPEPTATTAPSEPTSTPVPPTPVPVPTATATPRIVTATPTTVPTATTVPPTNTPIVVLATATTGPGDGTAEPEVTEESGGCGSAHVPMGTAAINMLLLMGPLAMIGGAKYRRRRKL